MLDSVGSAAGVPWPSVHAPTWLPTMAKWWRRLLGWRTKTAASSTAVSSRSTTRAQSADVRLAPSLEVNTPVGVHAARRACQVIQLTFVDSSPLITAGFAKERKQWPKWDGVIHNEVLPNQWEASSAAAREWFPKIKAAEKREAEALMAAEEMRRQVLEAEANGRDERAARQAAEEEAARVRASISASERACVEASRKVAALLERERGLRAKLQERLSALPSKTVTTATATAYTAEYATLEPLIKWTGRAERCLNGSSRPAVNQKPLGGHGKLPSIRSR